jgi:hypothetical protein
MTYPQDIHDSVASGLMQFTKSFWPGLAEGSITMTFRRWKRRQVVPGNRYRTPGGILEVEEVDVVRASTVTDDQARRAGFSDASTMLAQLRGDLELPLYRVVFHRVDEPDPRDVLAKDGDPGLDALAEISTQLTRMDRSSKHGVWTRAALELIVAHPGRRAPDLAELMGVETATLKRDIRKLKNLGLTFSLQIGYELSPRGEAYLEWFHSQGVVPDQGDPQAPADNA